MATTLAGDFESVSATDAKNSFGAVLDKVIAGGRVAITKYEAVRAVVLSVREYEALIARQEDPLAALSHEFDGLVERMQAKAAKNAGRSLFEAAPKRLGKAAVARARARARG